MIDRVMIGWVLIAVASLLAALVWWAPWSRK